MKKERSQNKFSHPFPTRPTGFNEIKDLLTTFLTFP